MLPLLSLTHRDAADAEPVGESHVTQGPAFLELPAQAGVTNRLIDHVCLGYALRIPGRHRLPATCGTITGLCH